MSNEQINATKAATGLNISSWIAIEDPIATGTIAAASVLGLLASIQASNFEIVLVCEFIIYLFGTLLKIMEHAEIF